MYTEKLKGFQARMIAIDETLPLVEQYTAAETVANEAVATHAAEQQLHTELERIQDAIDTVILNAPVGSNAARHFKRRAERFLRTAARRERRAATEGAS